jgi:hypothetical protein
VHEQQLDLATVWERLNDAFLDLYHEILRNTPTVKWWARAWDTEFFLLSGYAQFDRVGCPDDEDLAIEIGIFRRDEETVWDVDACQAAGVMLSQGPTYTARRSDPIATWIGEPLEATLAWIRDETPNFIAYLNREPTPYDED